MLNFVINPHINVIAYYLSIHCSSKDKQLKIYNFYALKQARLDGRKLPPTIAMSWSKIVIILRAKLSNVLLYS